MPIPGIGLAGKFAPYFSKATKTNLKNNIKTGSKGGSFVQETAKAADSLVTDPFGGIAGVVTSLMPGGIIPAVSDSLIRAGTRLTTGEPQGLFEGLQKIPQHAYGGRSVMSYYPY